MSAPRVHISLIACALAACLLAGCGGSGSGEAGEVEEMIRTAVLSTDPADCTVFRTQKYLNQAAQQPGEAAVEECEEEADDPVRRADSVDVSKVVVDGSSATAVVEANGGYFGDQAVEVAVAKEDGEWKLDEVKRFVGFDAAEFARATKEISVASGDVSPQQARCIGRKIEGATRQQVEALVLSGRPSDRAVGLILPCLAGPERQSAGELVAPDGAEYSYRVPAGFLEADPESSTETSAESAVGPDDEEEDGQGVIVAQIPGAPVQTPADLQSVLPHLTETFEAVVTPLGATASPARTMTIDGHLAVQFTATGVSGGADPGLDLRETIVFVQPEAVMVACRWKPAQQEKAEILRACDSVLRSLRVTDGQTQSSSS